MPRSPSRFSCFTNVPCTQSCKMEPIESSIGQKLIRNLEMKGKNRKVRVVFVRETWTFKESAAELIWKKGLDILIIWLRFIESYFFFFQCWRRRHGETAMMMWFCRWDGLEQSVTASYINEWNGKQFCLMTRFHGTILIDIMLGGKRIKPLRRGSLVWLIKSYSLRGVEAIMIE